MEILVEARVLANRKCGVDAECPEGTYCLAMKSYDALPIGCFPFNSLTNEEAKDLNLSCMHWPYVLIILILVGFIGIAVFLLFRQYKK